MSPIFIITDIIQIRQKKRENIKDLQLRPGLGNNDYSQEPQRDRKVKDIFWTPVGIGAVYFIAS